MINTVGYVDDERNKLKPLLKLQFDKANDSNNVRMTEIMEKPLDRINNEKYLERPLNRNDFNFKFSTMNVHDWSVRKKHIFSNNKFN